MWTSTLELNPRRVLMTQLLGRVWRGAYFSSFAPLQVQNLPRQPLPASSDWVRVRNHLAGICGSDLHLIYLDGSLRSAPAALPGHTYTYPGHEVVGEVVEVGDEVKRLHVGDRVVLQSGPSCLSAGVEPPCRSCAAGNYNLCEQGNLPGPEPVGGGWSEEMLLSEKQLFRIPSTMSDEQAVLLEPSAVAVHAVLRHVPRPGDHVLIIGAGTIGLLVLQVLRALAPQTRVSVMARHAFQVEQATRMGASYILYPQDTYQSVKLTTGAQLYSGMFGNKMMLGGYDAIYDTVGTQRTLHDALRWTRAGGSVVLIGVNLHLVHIDLSPVWYQEVNLLGSVAHGMETWPIGSREHRSTFSVATELIQSGQIQPEKLITHRFALSNFKDALSASTGKSQSRAIKVVFDYALMPATVVPNVRATGRQRRPATTTITQAPEPATPLNNEEPAVPQEISRHTGAPVPSKANSDILQPPATLPPSIKVDDDRTVTVPKLRRTRQIHIQPLPKNTEDIQISQDAAENAHAQPTGATNGAPETLEGVDAPSPASNENP
ncbi:MAG TPA: alcohol dehydrogenase catalytic domain-containing protein [Ktedonobacteraceae bacterium]|nr:alcohol dehydrogenase catalytic domain-containing protein [Ktedonobacteraceae bacterium]